MSALPRLSIISSALISAILLAGCSEDSKMIDLVKNSKSLYDNLPMGSMLENTKVCSQPKWSYQETKRGEHFVYFECTPNIDLSIVKTNVEKRVNGDKETRLANIKKYSEIVEANQRQIDTINTEIQKLSSAYEDFRKTDLTNSIPVFYYQGNGVHDIIRFKRALYNVSPEQWNDVFHNVITNRYDEKKLNAYLQKLRETTKIYIIDLDGNWDNDEIDVFKQLYNLPKNKCFDAWKNKILPGLQGKRYVHYRLARGYNSIIEGYETLYASYQRKLESPVREVERFNQYIVREQEHLSKIENTTWTKLKDATLYVKFSVDPEKDQIMEPRGPRSGYVLRWEDGTENNQFGFSTMLVPMYLEGAAEKDDVKSLEYWVDGLSKPKTLEALYQQGTKPAPSPKK